MRRRQGIGDRHPSLTELLGQIGVAQFDQACGALAERKLAEGSGLAKESGQVLTIVLEQSLKSRNIRVVGID